MMVESKLVNVLSTFCQRFVNTGVLGLYSSLSYPEDPQMMSPDDIGHPSRRGH